VRLIAEVLKPKMSILDVGCGNGSILRHLQKIGFNDLHGLELSDYAVRRLSGERINMSKGNLINMPFADKSFDAVIASEVLEHVVRRKRFLREMIRVLKPSGKILIFVPDDTLGPISEPEHVTKYNEVSLRKFLAKFVSVETLAPVIEPHIGARSLFAVCGNKNAPLPPSWREEVLSKARRRKPANRRRARS
jgi:ubiquinone/menaquinone biosynthesis C-methylase UbiE